MKYLTESGQLSESHHEENGWDTQMVLIKMMMMKMLKSNGSGCP